MGSPSGVKPAGTVIAGNLSAGLRRRLFPGPAESSVDVVSAFAGIFGGG